MVQTLLSNKARGVKRGEKWAQSNEINFIFNSKMPQSSFYGTGCSRCCSLLIFMNWKPKLPLPNWAALLLEHVSSLAELGNFYDLRAFRTQFRTRQRRRRRSGSFSGELCEIWDLWSVHALDRHSSGINQHSAAQRSADQTQSVAHIWLMAAIVVNLPQNRRENRRHNFVAPCLVLLLLLLCCCCCCR